jgi:hypothetical protein
MSQPESISVTSPLPRMVRRGIALLLVVLLVGFAHSVMYGSATGVQQVVLVHASGIGISTRDGPGLLARDPLLISVEVQNRSGGDVVVNDVGAVIIDAAGTIYAETRLMSGEQVRNGANETYRESLTRRWPNNAVLGLWTCVRGENGQPTSASNCGALSLFSGNKTLKLACEEFSRLTEERCKVR